MAIPTHKLFDGRQTEPQSSSIEAPRRVSKTSRVSVLSSGSQEPKIRKSDMNNHNHNHSHDHSRTSARPRMNQQMSVSFHRPHKSSDRDRESQVASRGVPRRISSLFSGNNSNNDSRPSSPVPGQKELLQSYLERRVEQMAEETIQTLNQYSDPDDELNIPEWGDDGLISVEVPEMDDEVDIASSRPTTVRIKETPRYHEAPRERPQDSPGGSSYDDDVDAEDARARWEDVDSDQPKGRHTTRPSLRSARSVGYRSAGGRSQTSSALSRQMSSIPVEQIQTVFNSQQREQMQDLYMNTFMQQLQVIKKTAKQEATEQFNEPLNRLQSQWDDATKQLQSKEEETAALQREIERLREDKDRMERRILDSVRLESRSREEVVKERQAHIQTKQEMDKKKLELEKMKMQFGIQEKKMRHSIHFGEVRKTIQASRPQSTRASRLGTANHFNSFGSRGVPTPERNGKPIAIDLPSTPETTVLLSPQAQRVQQSLQRARKSAPEQELEEGIRRLRAKLQLARANAENISDGPAKARADRDVKFVQPKEKPLLWSGARKGPGPSPGGSTGHQRKKSKSMFLGRIGGADSKRNGVSALTPTNWRERLLAHVQRPDEAKQDMHGLETPRSTTATIGTNTPASKGRTPVLVNGRSVKSFGEAMPSEMERKLNMKVKIMEREKNEMKLRMEELERQLAERDNQIRNIEDDEKKVEEKIAPMPNPNMVLPPVPMPISDDRKDRPRKRRMSTAALERVDLPAKPRAQPRRNMRRLDWKPTASVDLQGTVWSQINDSDVYLDTRDIEVHFGEKRRRRRKTSEVPEYKNMEDDNLRHFIPEKRRYFVHEALRRFRLSPDEIRRSLVVMDETMTADTLIKLLDIIPTLDEQNTARIYLHSSRETLGFAEYFFAKLSDVSYLRDRIQLWLFKLQFQEIIGQYRNEIAVLNDCLMSIKESVSLPQFLKVTLAVGNYINSNSPNKGGAYGFDLTSLSVFDNFKANNGKLSFLAYLVKYCEKYYPSALDVVDQVRSSHDAAKAQTDVIAQNVMDVNGELTKLGSSLRKFTKHPIEIGDQFVPVMKGFHREALRECKTALDEWHAVRELSKDISKMFDLSKDVVEDVCGVFDNLVSAIRRARSTAAKADRKKQIEAQNRAKIKKAQEAVESRLSNRPRPPHLHAKNIITHESTHRQREEVKRQLSKLVHERSKLLEFQQSQNDGEMTVQRLKYLRDLIKSAETATNTSNPLNMAQKQRRRRRSLTADELGIGLSLPNLIKEDDEVR